jgi:CO/xanthine dehydrogenase Mo-binding subunit
MHGQVIDGLGEALAQEVTVDRGRTGQSNLAATGKRVRTLPLTKGLKA